MKVFYYRYENKYYWVAESDYGYRTTAFEGEAPTDSQPARAALAAAYVIDCKIETKSRNSNALAALEGLTGLMPKTVRIARGTNPAVLLLSRPGDDIYACVAASDPMRWIGEIAFGKSEVAATNAAVAAISDQAPDVSVVSFVEAESFDPGGGI